MKYDFGSVAHGVGVRENSDTATTEKLNSFIEAARALEAVVKGDAKNEAAQKSADSSRQHEQHDPKP